MEITQYLLDLAGILVFCGHRHSSETDQHALRCSIAQILLLKNEKEKSPKRLK